MIIDIISVSHIVESEDSLPSRPTYDTLQYILLKLHCLDVEKQMQEKNKHYVIAIF